MNMLTSSQRKAAARSFAARWKGRGYEKGETQKFWLELLEIVLGVERPFDHIDFESQVVLDHTNFIDAYIPSAKVLVEQKSLGKDLRAKVKQSDGTLLTPFQQAKRYIIELPNHLHPKWVVISNFAEFHIYDMDRPQGEPEVVLLKDLETEHHRLAFLAGPDGGDHVSKELEVSMAAGKVVALLYDALAARYKDPESESASRSLNLLCVRLVFCLYAEDAGVFGRRDIFHDYLSLFEARHLRGALIDLFKVLDTPAGQRDPYLDEDLAAFPYVNGGLFSDTALEIPQFTDEIRTLLIQKASLGFDWSQISPTIFGALFESTLSARLRHSGGMHYTSIANIHKVIDPLFLGALEKDFEAVSAIPEPKRRVRELRALQDRLASLTILDPACGSGNFLTETFLSLRRLENKILGLLLGGDRTLGAEFSPIKVSIGQFYGIEINDYAASVAKTALWIAESQMMRQTEDIVQADLDILPLKSYSNIAVGNALRLDWESLVSKDRLDYIIGNPPFLGNNNLSPEQREDVAMFFKDNKTVDYVSCWFAKATRMLKDSSIKAAFVATNSITQGEQVPIVWKGMMEAGIHIDFAHRTFRWDNESTDKAHVHCVIVGFSSAPNPAPRLVFSDGRAQEAANINAYLADAENVFVLSRSKPLCAVPAMRRGNQPTDGGFLIIEADEYADFVAKEPGAKPFIKKLIGSKEYINNLDRYCLWLVDASPADLRKMPLVMKRLVKVREKRLASPDPSTRKLADTPHLFRETNNPDSFIVIPRVSSERRRYVPIGFMDGSCVPTDLCQIIPSATLYHFGVLTSSVHMAWMRAVCGRLKSDYRYSKDIVYNNFPWPEPSPSQKERIEKAAQAVLDARALFPDCSLADLYDEVAMPPGLRRSHHDLDRAVLAAYSLEPGSDPVGVAAESAIVAHLMKLYKALTEKA